MLPSLSPHTGVGAIAVVVPTFHGIEKGGEFPRRLVDQGACAPAQYSVWPPYSKLIQCQIPVRELVGQFVPDDESLARQYIERSFLYAYAACFKSDVIETLNAFGWFTS